MACRIYSLSNVAFAADVGAIGFTLSTAASGGTLVMLTCLLAGTRIETPLGGVTVETLAVGGLVLCLVDGSHVPRAVRWIGGRTVEPGATEPDWAREAAPVRICAHAFADGIPERDLLVTGVYCLFESRELPVLARPTILEVELAATHRYPLGAPHLVMRQSA